MELRCVSRQDDARHDARAERYEHANAGRRRGQPVGHGIGQRVDRGDRDRHGYEAHGGYCPAVEPDGTARPSTASAVFRSSHAYFFWFGLRSRKEGWKVGISFAPW